MTRLSLTQVVGFPLWRLTQLILCFVILQMLRYFLPLRSPEELDGTYDTKRVNDIDIYSATTLKEVTSTVMLTGNPRATQGVAISQGPSSVEGTASDVTSVVAGDIRNITSTVAGPASINASSPSSDVDLDRGYHYVGDTTWTSEVTCQDLVDDKKGINEKVKKYLLNDQRMVPKTEDILQATKNCSRFRRRYNYRQTPASEEEARYPIAYSVMIYKDAAQFEMLLRAIYHPQNVYCIHVDTTADSDFKEAISSLVSCFHDVFLATNPVDVIYGHVSRLEADFSCMRDLLQSKVPWKYLINLTGQEFPIKTNYEIVQILKALRDNTDMDVNMPSINSMRFRFRNHWQLVDGKRGRALEEMSDSKKEPLTNGIRIVKGGAYGIFGRDFLSYVLSMPPEVKELLDWVSDIWSPDEMFWATIYMRKYNPMFKTPGGFDAETGERTYKVFLAKAVVWENNKEGIRCHGKFLRAVCVYNSGAMAFLTARPELFANKFIVQYDHVILNCLGEWIQRRTDQQPPFDVQFYNNYTKRHFG